MSSSDKASRFKELHIKGNPLVLYNAWDAGSAKAILEGGGRAIGTSSWSMATAHGYSDGEGIPLTLAQTIVSRIVQTVDAPVTLDFEGGYSDDIETLNKNIDQVLDSGVVGINFEDRVVKGKGLHPVDVQVKRIEAIRKAAGRRGVDLFINARCDVFFGDEKDEGKLFDEATLREAAYAKAGASGFFAPGLKDEKLMARIVKAITLPLNIMVMSGTPANQKMAELGVSRISYGPIPYIELMKGLSQAAGLAHSSAR